jgi:predicted peptidase
MIVLLIVTAALFAQDSAGTQPSPRANRLATGFLYRTLAFDGESYAYTVFVPPDYTPDSKWPVILFLHGSGERGADGFVPSEVGIGRAIRRNYRLCPALVVMPQCRKDQYWNQPMLDMALRCVRETSMAYNVDGERFTVTGLSLGGAGTWELGARMGDQLAAIAPVCGFVDDPRRPPSAETVASMAARLGDVPVWCFHGEIDTNVVVDHSRAMVAELRRRDRDVQYTEYPGAKHGIWDRVYSDQRFWAWLLSQRRAMSPTSQPAIEP